ncbi:MAG: hypothetical protein EXS03_07230 [Phycisphaerales bacterium]|nr:hypothetical protein [Phycisphaerales bacterium]
MIIRILYFDGCPNFAPSVAMANRLVLEHRLDGVIEAVAVEPGDLASQRFLGSPTIQIDGVDIDPTAADRTDYSMSCRLYLTPDGLPSEEMFRAALGVDANRRLPHEGVGGIATLGSVVAALGASACCWGPLLLIALGGSAIGVSATVARWRPVLIAGAILMLGASFYFAYRRRPAVCGACCRDGRRGSRRLQRALLWPSAAIVAVLTMFPHQVTAWIGEAEQSALKQAPRTTRPVALTIAGMTCERCATTLRDRLVQLEGVGNAHVDFTTRRAEVEVDSESQATVDEAITRIRDAAAALGYTATPSGMS